MYNVPGLPDFLAHMKIMGLGRPGNKANNCVLGLRKWISNNSYYMGVGDVIL